MRSQKSYNLGPSKTFFIIKLIIIISVSLSALAALSAPMLKHNYIGYILGLSLDGIKSFYVWQLLTYNFLQPNFGITISFLIHILFNLYIIWAAGTFVVERTSQGQFLFLYLSSAIFTALTTLLVMLISYPHFMFASTSIGVFTTLIAWMMLSPKDARIFLFSAFPIKLSHIVFVLLGINLFSDLSNLQFVNFFAYLSCAIYSYFFSVIVWQRHGPITKFANMEKNLITFFRPIVNRFKRKNKF